MKTEWTETTAIELYRLQDTHSPVFPGPRSLEWRTVDGWRKVKRILIELEVEDKEKCKECGKELGN